VNADVAHRSTRGGLGTGRNMISPGCFDVLCTQNRRRVTGSKRVWSEALDRSPLDFCTYRIADPDLKCGLVRRRVKARLVHRKVMGAMTIKVTAERKTQYILDEEDAIVDQDDGAILYEPDSIDFLSRPAKLRLARLHSRFPALDWEHAEGILIREGLLEELK